MDKLSVHLIELLQLPEAVLREIASKTFAQFVSEVSTDFLASIEESITTGLTPITKAQDEPTGAEPSMFGADVELADEADFESILLSEPGKMKVDNSGLTFSQRLCDFAEVVI